MNITPVKYQLKISSNNDVNFKARKAKIIKLVTDTTKTSIENRGMDFKKVALPVASTMAIMMGVNATKLNLKREVGSTGTTPFDQYWIEYNDKNGDTIKNIRIDPQLHEIHIYEKYDKNKQISTDVCLTNPILKGVVVQRNIYSKNFNYECRIDTNTGQDGYLLTVDKIDKDKNGCHSYSKTVLKCLLDKDLNVIGKHGYVVMDNELITLDKNQPLSNEVIKEYDLTKPFDAMKKGLELLEMPKKKAIKTAISRFDAQVQS